MLLDKKQYLREGDKAHGPNFVFSSIIHDWYSINYCFWFDKVSIRIHNLLQLFLILLTAGIKIDPCQYPGSNYPDQNTKLNNSLTNHSGDRALLTTGTKIEIN